MDETEKPAEHITFPHALVSRISSTIDGGWNLTFSIQQNDVKTIAQLMEWRDKVICLSVISGSQ